MPAFKRLHLLPSTRSAVGTMAIFSAAILSLRAAEKDLSPVPGADPATAVNFEKGPQDPRLAFAYARKYGTALNDSLTGITTDALGNVYIAGNSVDSGSSGFLR